MNRARKVPSAPPSRPSIVLAGLIQPRSGDLPIAEPTTSAPMSLAATPRATMNRVSVPMLLLLAPVSPNRVSGWFDTRRISAPYAPSRPIHTMPIVVTAMFGSGPDSTPRAPMKPIDPAMKANATTSGRPRSPIQ